MNHKKNFLVFLASFLSFISISAQIYPPGVSIRLFQPTAGGRIHLTNNTTGERIPNFEIHINQGFDNEERYDFASVAPFTRVRVHAMPENERFRVTEIRLNGELLPTTDPVFQGWRDGEVYDVTALFEDTGATSDAMQQSKNHVLQVCYNNVLQAFEVDAPERFKNRTVAIYSASGVKWCEQQILGEKTHIPFSAREGVYMLRMENEVVKLFINP